MLTVLPWFSYNMYTGFARFEFLQTFSNQILLTVLPWFSVDLQSSYLIKRVKITNRDENSKSPLVFQLILDFIRGYSVSYFTYHLF